MRGFVANTDYDWYKHLSTRMPAPDEVNFWQPSGKAPANLLPGTPFFFRLKKPYYAIAGFGYFAHFSRLPLSLAWEAFEEKNGAATLDATRWRIARYRKETIGRRDDPEIGCSLIVEPVFFPEDRWVREPDDWARNIVQGKTYDLQTDEGERIHHECLARAMAIARGAGREPAAIESGPRYGEPSLHRPRLGQGTFRAVVLDAYGRSCAVTTEHSLPVLEAAHIQPYGDGGAHAPENGLLLRVDIHKLFDRGFVTVDPEYRFRVSTDLREEWENGKTYYELEGRMIHVPGDLKMQPSRELLEWHGAEVWRG